MTSPHCLQTDDEISEILRLAQKSDESDDDYVYRLRAIRTGASGDLEQQKRIQILDAVETIKAGLDSVDDSFKKRILSDLYSLDDGPEIKFKGRFHR